MARRANPERINAARRAAVHANLTGSGMDAAAADRWIEAWILEATSQGLEPSRRPGW